VRFEACIFDLDGVLADSMPQHWQAYARVLAPLGVRVERAEVFRREGMNARHVVAEILAERGRAVSAEEAARLGAAKQDAFRTLGTPPLAPGAAEAVQALREAGLRLAVVTGTTQANVRFLLGPLAARFDALLADGDYARSKPDPEPYALAARRLGVPAQRCAVVENAPLGVRAAKAAGMACIALPTTVAPEELRAAGADAIAPDLGHAARLVLGGQGFMRA
jgi:beta-phosphoglucomutase